MKLQAKQYGSFLYSIQQQQQQNQMAFIFRSENKLEQHKKTAEQVGPGSYNLNVAPRQSKIPKAYVPFGSMEPKNKDNALNLGQNSTALVGPGSYNLDVQRTGQKIIVSSETEDIKILEISRPNPVFKSGVNRFPDQKEDQMTPGPGEYNVRAKQFAVRAKIMSTVSNAAAKPKILEHLINLNQYQSIPSIPSNIHAFGYNQNQNNELELNEPPVEYFKGDKEDKVGPGQYNPNVAIIKARGLSWSQPKTKKITELPKIQQPGPGSYQINATLNPLYNYKPSVGFASKTLRTMDQRKGAVVQANFDQKNQVKQIQSNPAESRTYSQKAPPSTHIDSDSDGSQYEYIDETTPGPGSYLEITADRRPKAGKTATSFGGSKRFEPSKVVKKATNDNPLIGPGSYNIQGSLMKREQNRKGGVLMVETKEKERCPSLYTKNQAQLPGPGAYEPRNTMEDKLIYKIQRGYRGQFGSTEARGKQAQDEQIPGPGAYNPALNQGEKQVSSSFKSRIERKIVDEKKVVPAVGSYNMIYHDIATKVIKEEEQDPDLVIKKPGFGVGETRFQQASVSKDDYEEDDFVKQVQEKYKEERRLKMLKNSSVFRSKEPRFKETKGPQPGPGTYYDGEQDYWNKRTYNILFADI